MKMYLISKQATIAAIVRSLGVPQSAESKIAVRISILSRSGFPQGPKFGQGHRGGYTVAQFWQLITVFQIMRAGVSTGRSSEIVAGNWEIVQATMQSYVLAEKIGATFYWGVRASGLSDFGPFEADSKEAQSKGPRRTLETLLLEKDSTVVDLFNDLGEGTIALVNASKVVRLALGALENPSFGIDVAAFVAASVEWTATSAKALRSAQMIF